MCPTLTLAVDNFSCNCLQWTSCLLQLIQNLPQIGGITLVFGITCLWKFHFIVQSKWFNTFPLWKWDFQNIFIYSILFLSTSKCYLFFNNFSSLLRSLQPIFCHLKTHMVDLPNTLIPKSPDLFMSILAIPIKLQASTKWLPYFPTYPHFAAALPPGLKFRTSVSLAKSLLSSSPMSWVLLNATIRIFFSSFYYPPN